MTIDNLLKKYPELMNTDLKDLIIAEQTSGLINHYTISLKNDLPPEFKKAILEIFKMK